MWRCRNRELAVRLRNWQQFRQWKSERKSRVRLFVTPYSPWNSLGQNTGVNSLCLLKGEGDLPNSRFKPRSPTLQADSLPAEPQGKLKDTGVGSLSLLQWIFQTQESNRGLLHCRQILYQLSYQGSKARKHKETDCPQELPERLEPCQYLDLGPIKPILNFWPWKL